MKCSNCAYQNQPDAKFCQNCGNRLQRICPNCSTVNDLDSARTYFSQALAHFDELRATPYIERTRSRMAQLK